MSKRGVIVLSGLLGLFAVSFGVFGLSALASGPDGPTVSQSEIGRREAAADRTAAEIRRMREEMPSPRTPAGGSLVPSTLTGVPTDGDDDASVDDDRDDSDHHDRDDDHGERGHRGDHDDDDDHGDRDHHGDRDEVHGERGHHGDRDDDDGGRDHHGARGDHDD